MDKATKLTRIKFIRAAARRAVKEIGSWIQVKIGSRDCAIMGAEIGDVKIILRTPFPPLPPMSQWLRYQRALLDGRENLH